MRLSIIMLSIFTIFLVGCYTTGSIRFVNDSNIEITKLSYGPGTKEIDTILILPKDTSKLIFFQKPFTYEGWGLTLVEAKKDQIVRHPKCGFSISGTPKNELIILQIDDEKFRQDGSECPLTILHKK